MIALFILTFCLLGIVAFEIKALRTLKSAYYQSLAVQQLANKLEQAESDDISCELWNQENRGLLPSSNGTCNFSTEIHQASLCWFGVLSEMQCMSLQK